MARKTRLLLAVLIFMISSVLLIWGIWPEERVTRIQPLQPTQMQLPTPVSLLATPWFVDRI